MGMDLYSVDGGEYYRFNWSGWSGLISFLESIGADIKNFDGLRIFFFGGSNDGRIVPEDDCEGVADAIAKVLARLKDLISCSKTQLLLKMKEANERPVLVGSYQRNIAIEIVQTRLKGDHISLRRLSTVRKGAVEFYTPVLLPGDFYDLFAYYVGFGKFCRKCAELGGFSQC
jgi:hypothetical protein